MSSSKKQSLIMTGIGLIMLSAIMLYFGLSQPRISESKLSSLSYSQTAETVTDAKSRSSSTLESSTTNDTTATAVTYPININTCTAEELMCVDGIGEARAQAIIQYRDYLGGYDSVKQIKDIKGFGDSIYEKVAPYLTV